MRCPVCNEELKLVYVSKDGKVKFYKCLRGHRISRKYLGFYGYYTKVVVAHPVFMVEEVDE